MLQTDKTQAKKVSAKKQATAAQSSKNSAKKISPRQKQTAHLAITPEHRQQMIEEAAYFIAEHQGFNEHTSLEYWLAAEAEIDRQLSQ